MFLVWFLHLLFAFLQPNLANYTILDSLNRIQCNYNGDQKMFNRLKSQVIIN